MITPEQRAAWLEAAEAAVGLPSPGWLDQVRESKPSVLECTGAQFFAVCRLARAGGVTIYGMKADRILALGWPEPQAPVQQDLI